MLNHTWDLLCVFVLFSCTRLKIPSNNYISIHVSFQKSQRKRILMPLLCDRISTFF